MLHQTLDASPKYILEGPEKNYTIKHDAHNLDSKEYEVYGKLIALSFLHGGPGPHNWSKPLAQYILGLQPELQIECVPIFEIQKKLNDANKCTTQEELDFVMSSFNERFDAGYNKIFILLEDVAEMTEKVCRFFILTRQLEEIQQLCTGLNSNGILDTLKKHPLEAMKEFIYDPNTLTPDLIRDLYEIEYSQEGTDERTKEQDIVYQWENFLDEINCEQNPDVTFFPIEEENKIIKMSLEEVLKFLTGSKYIPMKSYKKNIGKIAFRHENPEGRRISTSTCMFSMIIPVNERYIGGQFSMSITKDIIESPGYGKV